MATLPVAAEATFPAQAADGRAGGGPASADATPTPASGASASGCGSCDAAPSPRSATLASRSEPVEGDAPSGSRAAASAASPVEEPQAVRRPHAPRESRGQSRMGATLAQRGLPSPQPSCDETVWGPNYFHEGPSGARREPPASTTRAKTRQRRRYSRPP